MFPHGPQTDPHLTQLSGPELELVPYDEATPPRFSTAQLQPTVWQLDGKIPRTLRGNFYLQFDPQRMEFVGLQLAPNAASMVMHQLCKQVEVPLHGGADHKKGSTMAYSGEDFRKIIASDANSMTPPTRGAAPLHYRRTELRGLPSQEAATLEAARTGHARDIGTIQAQQFLQAYHEQGYTYRYTTSFDQLLATPGALGFSEQEQVKRLSSAIPENLRGSFCCDLVKDKKGELLVGSFGIDPSLLCNRFSRELLHPVLKHDKQAELFGKAPSHHLEPSALVGIRPHFGTYMLARDAYVRLTQQCQPLTMQRSA